MPYFKYRIKETTKADVIVEAKDSKEADELLYDRSIEESHRVRKIMDESPVVETELLACVDPSELETCKVIFYKAEKRKTEPDFDLNGLVDIPDGPINDEMDKPKSGRYPYGKKRDNIYRVRISDEFGTQCCLDATYCDFGKALSYIFDGVKDARNNGHAKATAVINGVSLSYTTDDISWWNVDVTFYKNGAPSSIWNEKNEKKG